MIRHTVSAVVRLRDSFRGIPADGAGALCRLDGMPSRPQAKAGGYLVWTDLTPGPHVLTITLPGFQPEQVEAELRQGAIWEGCADLKPGPAYPFGRDATGVTLALTQGGAPLADAAVWLAAAAEAPLKLAQDRAAKGAVRLRLFCKGPASALPLPGYFLVEDKTPELIVLSAFDGEEGSLGEPLAHAHARGKGLLPAQRYRTDSRGEIRVLLREAVRLAVLCGGSVQYVQPETGENRFALDF